MLQIVEIFEAIFRYILPVCYFSQGCFEPIRLNGFVVIVVVVDRLSAEQCHKLRAFASWQMTCLLCYYFCLCVCERLFKKAISVRIESPFVIGLPYSTVI